MSATTTTLFDDGWASVELDEELYPRDALQGAAYVFLDRSYVFLEPAGEKRVRIRLKAKTGDTAIVAGEFQNEALYQAYRRRLATENRLLIESLTSRALAGAAGPPGLDDLLDMDIGAETAFDDPLGIAMSWEEKYTKKKDKPAEGAAPASAEAPAAAGPSGDAATGDASTSDPAKKDDAAG